MTCFGKFMRVPIAAVMAVVILISSPISINSYATGTVTISMIGKYDSADTASIRSVDTETKEIRFRNHATGKTYTLSYDNTSMIYDERGAALSAQMLEVGQIVDVKFLKSSKHITMLNISDKAWTIDSTKDHELVRNDGTARIKSDIYKINAKTLVLADGEPALAENVLSTDRIKVWGIDKEIYSVIVTSGHGYVSLSSDVVEDQSLVGAWIELDNDVIHKISPNMLLSAPEGDYNLQIIGNGANYQSEVSISRNQETVVDTSKVNISKPKEGLVTFEIIPENAEVFVDGKKVLTGVSQSVQYGYHNLKIMAEGYITQNKYLKVGTANSIVSIELEKDEDTVTEASTNSVSTNNATVDNNNTSKVNAGTNRADVSSTKSSVASTSSTTSSNSSSSTANQVISGYYIYFDAPYDAEVYFDGSYVGTIPTRVEKISGSHEVILKKDGYQTKSYRIKIDTDKDDVEYQFPDMVKNKSESSSSSASSASSSSSSSSSASSASSSSSSSSSASSSSSSSADSGTSASSAASSSADSGTSASSAASSSTDSGAGTSSTSSDDSTGTTSSSSSATDDTSTATTEDTSSAEDTTTIGSADETTSSSNSESTSENTGRTTNETEGVSDAASEASGET